jgi:hypothetical protein
MITYKIPKNHWSLMITDTAKKHMAPNFINLVQTAYAKTPDGSFVNSLKDVVSSNWNAYDWDKDSDADSVIFFRTARSNEPWKGYKIQGIGHDSQRVSIDKIFMKVKALLKTPGWWIEASDAMEHILYKDRSVNFITDESIANRIFPGSNLQMLSDNTKPGKYQRKAGPGTIKETIFGQPKLK